jgi:ribosomal protein RSM22 (predicted rRNA methylase)
MIWTTRFSSTHFFVAGIMAYGRCYASSGPGVPTLDAKQVYQGSKDGIEVHNRLNELRNTIAAHTDKSDLVRLTLAVREEPTQIVIQHLSTMAIPTNEIPDFQEAVSHTEHFVTVSINKYLNYLQTQKGKTIVLD